MKKCNEWMFARVKCTGYMKKVRDGVFIHKQEKEESPDNQEHFYYHSNEPNTNSGEIDLDEECGGAGILKTYYQHTKKEFDGIVVGMKMVEVTAHLFVDYFCDCYHEGYYIEKQTEEQVKCALVYYGCNKSRLVPMEDMEIIKEDMQ